MDVYKQNEVDSMTADTMVQKWGNSLAIRIPKEMAERIKIQQGTEIMLVEKEGKITIMPKQPPKKYSLEELLAQCKPETRHEEMDIGVEGKELI